MSRRNIRDLAILLSAWFLAIFIINPSGNFPINDDWSYSLTVKHWLETGQFKPGGWTSMTLWSHAAWGLVFSKLIGFSFETLRTSMLVMGVLGVLGTYALVKQVGGSNNQALLSALTLGFNPIYLDLSFSFMTDVSFIAMTTWATYFVVRYIQNLRMVDWWGALILGLVAVMCRQLGLCVFLGLAVGVLAKQGVSKRSLFLAIAPLLIGAASLGAFNHWLALSDRTPALYHLKEQDFRDLIAHPLRMAKMIARNSLITIIYTGLFLAPALLISPALRLHSASSSTVNRNTWLIGCALMISALSFMVSLGLMPVWSNGMDATGVGPLTLHDTLTLQLNDVAPLPSWWRLLMSAMTLLGVMVFVRWLALRLITDTQQWRRTGLSNSKIIRLALLFTALAYCAPLLALPSFYDRYVLLLMPLLMAMFVDTDNANDQKSRPTSYVEYATASVIFLFLGVLAIAGTHDHLSWNRARWQAIAELQFNQNPPLQEIDSGFEFNGLNFYDQSYVREDGKSWWRTNKETYLITFGPIKGTSVIKQYSYRRWLPAPSAGIFVLQKKSSATSTAE